MTGLPAEDEQRVAAVLRGGRGSQRDVQQQGVCGASSGGRPPGRPRIATPTSPSYALAPTWRPSSGAAEDRNANSPPLITSCMSVAAVLRGGRGSQRRSLANPGARGAVAAVLRGGRGSQLGSQVDLTAHIAVWRPSSGAAEDRNTYPGRYPVNGSNVAAVLRGGRGSQLDPPRQIVTAVDVAAVLRGGRGSQHQC